MKPTASLLHTLKNRFTGLKGVNPCFRFFLCEDKEPAGKNLGSRCLFGSWGDAKSRKTGLGNTPLGILLPENNSQENNSQGQLRRFINPFSHQEQAMPQRVTLKNIFKSIFPKALFAGLFLGLLFLSSNLWAHDGALLKDEITALEKLFTGGYMRLGLLGVCGFAAIYGIVKQSGWIFASGILGCVFAYFMKDWVLKTFTMII